MKIRTRLLSGFLMVFSFGLILGIAGIISVSSIAKLSNEQYELQKANAGAGVVLNAHFNWRHALSQSVLTGADFTGSIDPNTCALGKWKNSDEAKNTTDPEILDLLRKIEEPHNFIHNEAQKVVSLMKSGKTEEAKILFVEVLAPKTEETIAILSSMSARYTVLMEETSNKIIALQQIVLIAITALIVFAALATALCVYVVAGKIMNPIRNMTKAAETIALGDLDVTLEYPIDDEIGRLVKSFHTMIDGTKEQVAFSEKLASGDLTADMHPRSEKDVMSHAMQKMIGNLNKMFGDINSSTVQVSLGAKQIADGAQMLAQGSTEQAATVQELSSSISDMSEKTKDNASKAEKAANLANSIKDSAQKGSQQMDRMITAVSEINEASQSINKIIKVIDDIAFQTNILALNAAVEAARAGQHGKGFAVVADEVRNLAAKSAEAAKHTGSLIANSMEKTALGTRIANETAQSLSEIVLGIDESSRIVLEIAKASDSQSFAITDINRSIDQVAQVVHQNSATAEESAAASEEMSGQSDMLHDLVSQFKLKNSPNKHDEFSSQDNHTDTNSFRL